MEEQKIDSNRLDALKELANIGVGNAVTSLSQMLSGERVEMDVPVALLVPLQDISQFLGGDETTVVGVYIETAGDLSLTILFVLSLDSAANLISALFPGSSGAFDEMGLSVLMEVGNILTASYLNAISIMTDLQLLSTPPEVATDMAGAIISTVLAEAGVIDDQVVLLKTSLKARQTRIEGSVLILPDAGALEKIFIILGLG